jgi:hypothetical protein
MGSAVEHDFLTLLPELARRIRSHGDHSARQHRMSWAQAMIVGGSNGSRACPRTSSQPLWGSLPLRSPAS